jgi:rhodanese-related sulfurtransferase
MSEGREVEPREAAKLIAEGAALVDVRAQDEYDAGHIEGARHVPLDELNDEIAGGDRSAPIVFYCRGGERSAAAAEAFTASGWDAHSIAGGLAAWAEANLPLEPGDGHVAERSVLPPA